MNSVSSASSSPSFNGIESLGGGLATPGSLRSAQDLVRSGGNAFDEGQVLGGGIGADPLQKLMDMLQQLLGMFTGGVSQLLGMVTHPLKQLMGMIPGLG